MRFRLILALVSAIGESATPAPSIVYGTYLGGRYKECATAITADEAGNAYVVGRTPSPDFPITDGAFITKTRVKNDDWIGFVAKLSDRGDRLLYSSFIGGSFRSAVSAVAVDSAGRVYAVGTTCSADFPTSSSALLRKAPGGGMFLDGCDGFLIRLNPLGTRMEYGTYLGGSQSDQALAVAVDPEGIVYVAGSTSSPDFPVTKSALQPQLNGGTDGFLVSIDSVSGKVLYSTYLGGSGDDRVTAIKASGHGRVYIGGTTESASWSIPGSNRLGTSGGKDAFVIQLDIPSRSKTVGIRIGGSGDDVLSSIDVDSEGDIYAVGTTGSSDFPLTSGTGGRRNTGRDTDGFVVKLNGHRFADHEPKVLWSRLLGGSGNDAALSVSAGMPGRAFIVGRSGSTNFPTTPGALFPKLEAQNDSTLVQLRASDGRVQFATFLGGTRTPASWYNDEATGVFANVSGDVYVTGCTLGARLPVTPNVVQPRPRGNSEPFVLRLKFQGSSVSSK